MREIREIGFERNRVTDFENRAILRCSHANGALPPPFVSKKKKVSNFSYRLSTGELKFALKKNYVGCVKIEPCAILPRFDHDDEIENRYNNVWVYSTFSRGAGLLRFSNPAAGGQRYRPQITSWAVRDVRSTWELNNFPITDVLCSEFA